MKDTRLYVPVGEEVVYHYCDANALLKICQNQKIRFCDIFSMNDSMELHWGYTIFEEAASNLLDKVGRPFLDEVDKIIHKFGTKLLVTAACFSLDGDVLSQWRAYADDGLGYAIGFKGSDLIQLPVRPLRVLYNKAEQIKEMTNFILALHDVEKEIGFKYGKDFFDTCAILSGDLAALKNPAFAEEKEIRLCHLLNFELSNSGLKLVDGGGVAWGQKYKPGDIHYKMKQSVPVPFIELKIVDPKGKCLISHVIVGPRNETSLTNVGVFLETLGISNVEIRRSEASYR